jgi:hypothetical protein
MKFGLFNSYINRSFREGTTPETWYHIVPLRALYTVLKYLHHRRVPEYRVPWSFEDKYEPNKCNEIKGQWGLKVLSTVSELRNVNNMPTLYPQIYLSSIYLRFSF